MSFRLGAQATWDTHMNTSTRLPKQRIVYRTRDWVRAVVAGLALTFIVGATPPDTKTWIPVGAPGSVFSPRVASKEASKAAA